MNTITLVIVQPILALVPSFPSIHWLYSITYTYVDIDCTVRIPKLTLIANAYDNIEYAVIGRYLYLPTYTVSEVINVYTYSYRFIPCKGNLPCLDHSYNRGRFIKSSSQWGNNFDGRKVQQIRGRRLLLLRTNCHISSRETRHVKSSRPFLKTLNWRKTLNLGEKLLSNTLDKKRQRQLQISTKLKNRKAFS